MARALPFTTSSLHRDENKLGLLFTSDDTPRYFNGKEGELPGRMLLLLLSRDSCVQKSCSWSSRLLVWIVTTLLVAFDANECKGTVAKDLTKGWLEGKHVLYQRNKSLHSKSGRTELKLLEIDVTRGLQLQAKHERSINY